MYRYIGFHTYSCVCVPRSQKFFGIVNKSIHFIFIEDLFLNGYLKCFFAFCSVAISHSYKAFELTCVGQFKLVFQLTTKTFIGLLVLFSWDYTGHEWVIACTPLIHLFYWKWGQFKNVIDSNTVYQDGALPFPVFLSLSCLSVYLCLSVWLYLPVCLSVYLSLAHTCTLKHTESIKAISLIKLGEPKHTH